MAVTNEKSETEYSKREKFALNYYKKIIPTFYTDFFGILGAIKFVIFILLDYSNLFTDR